MKGYLIYLVAIIFLTSCGGSENGPGQEINSKLQTRATSSANLDSLDILYFTKPFTDSSRYTRFFSAVKVGDSSFLKTLEAALRGPSVVLEKPRPCFSEGKIIIPRGGDVFKVIYFSRAGEASCNYIYDIRDGVFYYYPLSGEMVSWLNDFEPRAKKVQ